MIKANGIFNFVSKKVGVTQDKEQYVALDVISKENQKLNFIIKTPDLIDKVNQMNIGRFQDVKLEFEFNREFNREKRVSYWSCEVVGVVV